MLPLLACPSTNKASWAPGAHARQLPNLLSAFRLPYLPQDFMGFLHLGWESATFEDDGLCKPLGELSPLWAAVAQVRWRVTGVGAVCGPAHKGAAE